MASRDLLEAFPALAGLDAASRADLVGGRRTVRLNPGDLAFEAGRACEQYLLVLGGSVRVHLLEAGGHEIVLYRIGRGDTCILTTAALLGSTPHTAYAVAEAGLIAAAIPATLFDALVARSAAFRRFVFATHGDRIVDLMRVVSDVAFARIPVRLARVLLDRVDARGSVSLTHDALAVEVGTAPVTPTELRRWLGEGGTTVIDIREVAERRGGSLPSAVSVPLSRYPALIETPPGATRVVFHCRSGKRTQLAAARLAASTAPPAVALAGGIDAWP